jgi:hypothetical protein
MSDEIDMAAAQEEAYRAAALNRRHASLPSVGQCYACGEPLEGSLRFCDTDCRDDWERTEAARKRGGR